MLRLKRTLRTARRRGWVQSGGTKRRRDGRPVQRGYENQDCTCILDLDMKGLHEEDLCPRTKDLVMDPVVARPEQERIQEVHGDTEPQPETNTNKVNMKPHKMKTHIRRKNQEDEDDQPEELLITEAASKPSNQHTKMISLEAPPAVAHRVKQKRRPRVKSIKGVRDIREFLLKGKVGGKQEQQGKINMIHNELGIGPMEPGLGGQDGHRHEPQDPS